MNMPGVTFVGQIDGSHVKAAVVLNGDVVTIESPVWLTLDQWNALRDANNREDDDESPLWAATVEEYEASVGETVTP